MTADVTKLKITIANNCIKICDLQKKANIPRPTLNNVLSGRSVRPATLGKVARALNVDVREIMEVEG